MNAAHAPWFSILAACLAAGSLSASPQSPPPNPPTLLPDQEEMPTPPPPPGPRILAEPSEEWVWHKSDDGGHPDGNEQQMVWLMNRARTDPTREGLFLAATGNARVDSAISFFSVDVEAMKNEFSLIEARPPAAFDRRMYEGSILHSEDLIARDAQDHNNQFDRITDAGFAMSGANASVFSFSEDAVHAHAALNIDWGNDGGDGSGMQPGRGHRDGIMAESLLSTNVGIAMVEENDEQTNVGPLVTSIVYARASASAADHYNRFLVGTVWEDANANDLYDPGEGLGGVTVMPNQGIFFAVTADSGGWAIPATVAGDYTLTFSGGDLAETTQRSATVASESVLVPWHPTDSFLGIAPNTPDISIEKTDTHFTIRWMAESDHHYQVQVSTDLVEWTDDDRPVLHEGDWREISLDYAEAEPGVFIRIVASRSD